MSKTRNLLALVIAYSPLLVLACFALAGCTPMAPIGEPNNPGTDCTPQPKCEVNPRDPR